MTNDIRGEIRGIIAKLNWLSQDQDLAYASDKRKEEIRQYHNGEIDKVTDQLLALMKPSVSREENERKTHLTHCYRGEYENSCKYLEDNCPAKPVELKVKMEWTDIVDIFLRTAQMASRDGDCDKWIITKKDLNEGAKILSDKTAEMIEDVKRGLSELYLAHLEPKEVCPACKGRALVATKSIVSLCKACRGTGKALELPVGVYCGVCNGTGKVTPKLIEGLEEVITKLSTSKIFPYDKDYYKGLADEISRFILDRMPFHGLLPLSNRKSVYCITCKYELKEGEETCPYNSARADFLRALGVEE